MPNTFQLMLEYISSIIYGFVSFLFGGMVVLIVKLTTKVIQNEVSKFGQLEKKIDKIKTQEIEQTNAIKEELKQYLDQRLSKMENKLKVSVVKHTSNNMTVQLEKLFKLLEEEKRND